MELISYLFSMFAVFYWIFRLVVSFAPNIGINLPIVAINPIAEIILLFISILGLIGIFKRKLFLTAIYLAGFFGYYAYEIFNIINSGEAIIGTNLQNIVIFSVGILIALANFLDVLFNKERKGPTKDKKIDWYYEEGKYEREVDDRTDKNRYKIK